MGKIRVKTLGDETQEQKEQKQKERQMARKSQAVTKAVEEVPENVAPAATEEVAVQESKAEAKTITKDQKQKTKVQTESARHKKNEAMVDKDTAYNLSKALTTLKNFKTSKFDETVELHLNVSEQGLNGQVSLPHGTGKKLRIKVADDAVIDEVAKGNINFDVLIARPDMMPKLAKVARVLGPRGLMPNPKAGTVTQNPEEVIEKLSAGQVNFKTEAQNPVIHMSVGKISFSDENLTENINTALNAVGTNKIKSAILKSTMSPGIRLEVK